MDPTQALFELRDLVATIGHDDADTEQLLEDIAVTLNGLDAWLSGGGFLPEPWSR